MVKLTFGPVGGSFDDSHKINNNGPIQITCHEKNE